jgi:hypothetical protein
MSPQPQNPQEKLLKEFSERSMSAPLIFLADKIGRNAKERCDLVFANRDVVLAMFMKRQEIDVKHKNVAKRDSDIRKNLGQATGLMRTWRAGVAITGDNPYGHFHIDYSSHLRIGILSIIDCIEGQGRWHDSEKHAMRVAFCATIPENVFRFLVDVGASPVDLIGILKGLPQDVPQDVLLNIAQIYVGKCQTRANLRSFWPNALGDDFRRVRAYLLGMRVAFVPNPGDNPRDSHVFQFFADLRLDDWFRLIFTLVTAAQATLASGHGLNEKLSLAYYDIAISTVAKFSGQQLDEAGKFADSCLDRVRAGERFCPHITAIPRIFDCQTADEHYTELSAYCQARRAAGWYVMDLTILPFAEGTALERYHIGPICFPPSGPPSHLSRLLAEGA